MENRFQMFVTDIAMIYKNIQRIKRYDMNSIGLRASHVMCLNYLGTARKGFTAAELCDLTKENKAGISRTLNELHGMGLIYYKEDTRPDDKRKYRAKAVLTDKGRVCAVKVRHMASHAVEVGGSGLTDEEREILYRVLGHVSDNLENYCRELEKEKK